MLNTYSGVSDKAEHLQAVLTQLDKRCNVRGAIVVR